MKISKNDREGAKISDIHNKYIYYSVALKRRFSLPMKVQSDLPLEEL